MWNYFGCFVFSKLEHVDFFQWLDPPIDAHLKAIIIGLLRKVRRMEKQIEMSMANNSNKNEKKGPWKWISMFLFVVIVMLLGMKWINCDVKKLWCYYVGLVKKLWLKLLCNTISILLCWNCNVVGSLMCNFYGYIMMAECSYGVETFVLSCLPVHSVPCFYYCFCSKIGFVLFSFFMTWTVLGYR